MLQGNNKGRLWDHEPTLLPYTRRFIPPRAFKSHPITSVKRHDCRTHGNLHGVTEHIRDPALNRRCGFMYIHSTTQILKLSGVFLELDLLLQLICLLLCAERAEDIRLNLDLVQLGGRQAALLEDRFESVSVVRLGDRNTQSM